MEVTELILLNDIGVTVDKPMNMFCNKNTAINISNNPLMHDRAKYIKIDFHFIHEKIDSKDLVLPYLKTQD